MDIRPQDLPEIRAELVEYEFRRAGRGSSEEAKMQRIAASCVAEAELFWVAAEMVELSQSAAASLPAFIANREDRPVPSGLMVFQEPLNIQGDQQQPFWIRAVAWFPDNRDRCLVATPYWDRDSTSWAQAGAPALMASSPLQRNMLVMPYDDETWQAKAAGTEWSVLFPILLSAWLLMQQPLADMSEVEPDRAARKRLRRLGQEPAAVRVIELRRPKHSGESGESGRDYRHQWIVRGHWRNHWHPKRQVHRPVWIAPHVKGPEGAPMIGGEKVYAWKR